MDISGWVNGYGKTCSLAAEFFACGLEVVGFKLRWVKKMAAGNSAPRGFWDRV